LKTLVRTVRNPAKIHYWTKYNSRSLPSHWFHAICWNSMVTFRNDTVSAIWCV